MDFSSHERWTRANAAWIESLFERLDARSWTWEQTVEVVESIREQFEQRGELSPGQIKALENIANRASRGC